jgi:hypothetical protein
VDAGRASVGRAKSAILAAVSTRAQATGGPRAGVLSRPPALDRLLPGAALLVGAALISGFTILRGGAEFDEGVVLAAAGRVADGQVPYADFLWPYGPAQPYVLGAWFELLGPSLMSWRILRVACDAAVALTVYWLVRRETSPRLALVAWLVAACAMAQPTSASPFPFALLLALLAYGVATAERPHAVAAGALIAAAAAWRLDFAFYGAAAVVVVLALVPERRRLLLPFAVPAVGLTLLVYLPFAIAAGPGELWDQLVAKSLREKEWWTLPFPLAYDGGFRTWPPGSLLEDVKDVLGLYAPLIAVAGLALAAVAALARRAERPWRLAGLLVLGAGGLGYLLSRADEFHVTPLIAVLAVAIPLCLRGARRPLALALAAVLLLLLAYGSWNRLSALVRPPERAAIEVPAADGAQAPPLEARALERMVAAVQGLVPEGDPIYVATRRSDLVAFNHPLVYVLAERTNATSEDFGLLATRAAQERTVAALERERPRAVVRWLDPISVRREDNKRGRSTGVRLVDRYLAREYRETARYGYYAILEPR